MLKGVPIGYKKPAEAGKCLISNQFFSQPAPPARLKPPARLRLITSPSGTLFYLLLLCCCEHGSAVRLFVDVAHWASPTTSSFHFFTKSLRAAASPPGGNEKSARIPGQPLEQRTSAEPQLIPLLRTLNEGAMPHSGHFGKSVISHPLQQIFVAAQLANGALKSLQVR